MFECLNAESSVKRLESLATGDFVYCVDLDSIGHGEGPLVVLWSETPRLLAGSARWSQQMLHSLPPPGFPGRQVCTYNDPKGGAQEAEQDRGLSSVRQAGKLAGQPEHGPGRGGSM